MYKKEKVRVNLGNVTRSRGREKSREMESREGKVRSVSWIITEGRNEKIKGKKENGRQRRGKAEG